MVKQVNRKIGLAEKLSVYTTSRVGTPASIIVHTFFFIGIFALKFIGFGTDTILLILTTLVSLEAIYLAIFIQMTVNRHEESLESVEDNLEDIQEDVEGISEDMEEITEDIDDIQAEEDSPDLQTRQTLEQIAKQIQLIQEELNSLKDKI